MQSFNLLETDILIKILSEYTAEYNRKIKAGTDALIDTLKTKIEFLQKLIELRNHNTDVIQSELGRDDLTTSKN
jgi:hypothetical protein